jgi:hypothetical protein
MVCFFVFFCKITASYFSHRKMHLPITVARKGTRLPSAQVVFISHAFSEQSTFYVLLHTTETQTGAINFILSTVYPQTAISL